jgi:hypothetical protein
MSDYDALPYLNTMRPWHRLFSVLGFLGAIFMGLGGIGMVFAGMGLLGLLYLAMAALYLMPALYLWRSADAIAANQVETSLENQAKFWRFVGWYTVIFLAIVPVVIIALTVLGGQISDQFSDVATAVSTAS